MRLDRSSAQQRAPSRRRVSAAAVAETDGIAFEKKTVTHTHTHTHTHTLIT